MINLDAARSSRIFQVLKLRSLPWISEPLVMHSACFAHAHMEIVCTASNAQAVIPSRKPEP